MDYFEGRKMNSFEEIPQRGENLWYGGKNKGGRKKI
jgi:hypothetical protein